MPPETVSPPEDAPHCVYIVRCDDDSYYTGYTTDVERRVTEHNDGDGAKYTKGRRPVKLVYIETFATRSAAQSREYEIKQFSRKDKHELVHSS